MNFQQIVLTVAIVIFIIIMIFIGSVLYQKKYATTFPPVISQCPDYWIDKDTSDDPNKDITSASQTCFNIKNLGNTSCSKTMDFTEDFWQGSSGSCNKYKWAKGCDLTWDGITNRPNICDTTSTAQ